MKNAYMTLSDSKGFITCDVRTDNQPAETNPPAVEMQLEIAIKALAEYATVDGQHWCSSGSCNGSEFVDHWLGAGMGYDIARKALADIGAIASK